MRNEKLREQTEKLIDVKEMCKMLKSRSSYDQRNDLELSENL